MIYLDSIMAVTLATLCTIAMLSSIFFIFLSLPGTWLILILSALWGFFSSSVSFTWDVYLVLTLLAIVGEVVEFFAGSIGAKKYGGSKKGSIGSIIGAVVGAFLGASFLFGIGALFGALAGAFIGSFTFEKWHKMSTQKALKASLGATLGRFGGFIAKLGVDIAMLYIAIPKLWA